MVGRGGIQIIGVVGVGRRERGPSRIECSERASVSIRSDECKCARSDHRGEVDGRVSLERAPRLISLFQGPCIS
jgi:hypothetical protein